MTAIAASHVLPIRGVGSNFGVVRPKRNQIPAGGAVSPPPPPPVGPGQSSGGGHSETPERVSHVRMSDILLS